MLEQQKLNENRENKHVRESRSESVQRVKLFKTNEDKDREMANKITSTPAPRKRSSKMSDGTVNDNLAKTIDYSKSEFLKGIGENHAQAFSKNASKFF